MNTLHREDYTLIPTGKAEVDTDQLVSLVNAIPDRGAIVKILDNGQPLKLSHNYQPGIVIEKPIWFRGETPNVRIERSSRFQFRIGQWQNPVSQKPNTIEESYNNRIGIYAFSGMKAGESVFSCKNVEIRKGDWICFMSDNPVEGNDSHLGGDTKPLQIRKVCYVQGDDIVLSSPVTEDMTINPRLQIFKPCRGVAFEDLTLSLSPGTNIVSNGITFHQSIGARLHNVTIDESGFGSIVFQRAVDTDIAGCIGLNQPNPDRDYGVVVLSVSGFRFRDSTWYECRHVITTAGFPYGKDRWGDTHDSIVEKVVAHCGGDQFGNSYVVFDSHAEGNRLQFRFCEVYAGGKDRVYGYGSRSKHTEWLSCKFHGAKNRLNPPDNIHVGWNIQGAGSLLRDCDIDNAWIGWRIGSQTKGNYADHRIINSRFSRCASVAILADGGSKCDGIEILNNQFRDCGWYDNPGVPFIPPTIIQIEGGTNHKIRGNDLDQQTNRCHYSGYFGKLGALDVELSGNYCRGYGKGKLGIRGDVDDPQGKTPEGSEIQKVWGSQNFTD